MTEEIKKNENAVEDAPKAAKRVIPRTTLIAAVVVLAAIAMIIIWANVG